MLAFTLLIAAAAAIQPALAAVYITSPVGTTTATGGQVLNVQWADDGNTPTVASIGPSTIDLYTGSTNNQIKLQNLAASVDVSKTSSVSATIDPSIGQDSNQYFIRVTSLSLASTTSAGYNYEAFSAMFSISAMTGTFNATVLAAIDATASNATSSAVSAASSVKSAATSATAKSTGSAASGTGSKTASTSSTSTAKSAAFPRAAPASLALALVGAATYLVL